MFCLYTPRKLSHPKFESDGNESRLPFKIFSTLSILVQVDFSPDLKQSNHCDTLDKSHMVLAIIYNMYYHEMFQFDVRSMTLDDYNMMTMTIFDDVPRDYFPNS